MASSKSGTSAKKPTSNFKPQPIVLTALDGFLLSGTLYLPPGPIVTTPPAATAPSNDPSDLSSTARYKQQDEPLTKVVIISSATAVLQDFYYKFALYLSQELGMIVVTYDNRGVGRSMPNSEELLYLKAATDNDPYPSGTTASSPVPPKASSGKSKDADKSKKNPLIGFEATIVDWSLRDLPGVFNYVLARFPHNPTLYVGHSVGGHILPAVDAYYTRNLERVLFVSVTSAHWRYMNSPLFTYCFFYIASPIVNSHYGFYPGKTLWNTMEDLPKGCLETWAHWGSFRNYVLGGNPEWKPNFDAFKVPIYSIYFSDDDYSSTSPPLIMRLIPNTLRRCVGVNPVEDLNMKKVGHMGFFFNSCKEKLWKTVVRAWFVDGHALDRDAIKEQATLTSSYARL
ncbi:MAG: Alpha/Beta hydrolase protein [Benniella sp.]|nr:MAG: Alpha/Beta hydrolase protein [Benniella sp.]